MALNKTHKKVRGATLIESLTALTIVSTVMGSAFALYEKTVSGEQQVMRTRAKHLQMAAENMLDRTDEVEALSDDFTSVEVEEKNISDHVKHVTCTFTTKNGKLITKKDYLRYLP